MNEYTPMIRQYLETKSKLVDTIVFYRLGDFYEMFFDDAKVASAELDLVLTGRDGGISEKIPMCGIPYHAASGYIQRLITKGYKVAIVEQMENPATAKGLVKRDVVRIYTPGNYIDEADDKNCTYIASISYDPISFIVVLIDMASGETLYTILNRNIIELEQFLMSMNVKEIVCASNFEAKYLTRIKENDLISLSLYDEDSEMFEYSYLLFGIYEPAIITSFYRLINYLLETCKQSLNHLRPVERLDQENELKMDYYTKRNLELTTTIRLQTKNGTLWHFLDKCKSSMGSRLLRKWIEHPLYDLNKITIRQNGVEYLLKNFLEKDTIIDGMKHVYDLERIVAKLAYKSANARDFIRLKNTLTYAPNILSAMANCVDFASFVNIDLCSDLKEQLEEAFYDEAPLSTKDGGMFKDQYNAELDEIRDIRKNGKTFIAEIEAREKEKTGIKSLKIGFNRVFGYYIEISAANINLVKEEYGYIRKQTLTNCERYITQELKDKEEAILHAEEKAIQLELTLFNIFLDNVQVYLPKLQLMANVLANLDVLSALSQVSNDYGYVRPSFSEGDLEIIDGKHPILAQNMKNHLFVGNDCTFKDEDIILLITGPNMGGKSTYMRQIGLIVIMAQMGCFVPCEKCIIPLFDQIFTRIGANDDLLSGQSTFMVEMMEANYALSNATKNSLILFDEIGRGTSTYDGMALAQSMMEYICENIKAKTLFSTHYHELTIMDEAYKSINNIHVEVSEVDGEITFLYKITSGKSDRSYGINVARLAKLPDILLERATVILDGLEINKPSVNTSVIKKIVVEKESKEASQVLDLLDKLELDDITPRESLSVLVRLQKLFRGEK